MGGGGDAFDGGYFGAPGGLGGTSYTSSRDYGFTDVVETTAANFGNGYVSLSLVVPEPSTYALFGLGAIGILIGIRRKKTA